MNLKALEDCPLHKEVPYTIHHVSESQFSVARLYGHLKYNNHDYSYFPTIDVLIRNDVVEWLRKHERDTARAKKEAIKKETDAKQPDLFDE